MNFEMNADLVVTTIFAMGIALLGYARLWKLKREKQLRPSRSTANDRTDNR